MAIKVEIGPYSAYALAVKNGYQGTEEEWLASLIGPKGDQGYQGASVTGAELDSEGNLILTITDPATGEESTINAGKVDTSAAVTAAVEQIEAAGTAEVEKVQTAGTEAVSAAQASIETAKTAALDGITQAQGAAESAVEQAGQAQVDKISALDVYTKTESNQRYAPIESAIKVSGTGTGLVSLSPTVAWGLQGLQLYGRTTQDGTPSPENPVPLVNAGDSGSITVQVTDGGAEHQQMTVQTPSGLPGIPVDSGGNFTDESGQQWICNVVDFGKNTFTQNLSVQKLSGTPNFVQSPTSTNTRRLAWNNALDVAFKTGSNQSIASFASWSSYAAASEYDTFSVGAKTLYFTPKTQMTPEEANSLFASLISSENAVIVAQLETPVTTALSAEEIAAYQALQSYSGTTNIIAPDCGIQATALGDATEIIADIKASISDAVTAAVALAQGGNT